jgi:lysophospholipase L1-like esterase
LLGVLTTAAAAAVLLYRPAPPGPTTPAPRVEEFWPRRHEALRARAARGGADLLFLGDSITEWWDHEPEVWDRFYGRRRAANFGMAGDGTEHVLWRIDDGELRGLSPRVVVLLIGTNDLRDYTPAEVATGVAAVVGRLRAAFPQAKILLLGIFPRAPRPTDPLRVRLQAVNERISRLDDGAHVHYLDIGRCFLNDDGTLSPTVMPDYLHLSREGYTRWAEAIEPTLREMLDGGKRFTAEGAEGAERGEGRRK